MSATSDHGLPCFFSQYPILRTDAVQKICVQVVLRELLECPASASWLKRKFCGCPQRPIFKRCSRREDHALAEEFSLRAHAARILKSQKGLGTAIRRNSIEGLLWDVNHVGNGIQVIKPPKPIPCNAS